MRSFLKTYLPLLCAALGYIVANHWYGVFAELGQTGDLSSNRQMLLLKVTFPTMSWFPSMGGLDALLNGAVYWAIARVVAVAIFRIKDARRVSRANSAA